MDARERDVDSFGVKASLRRRTVGTLLRGVHGLLNLGPKLVDPRAHVALGWAGSSLKPSVIDLGEDAVLARHPAVAKELPVVFAGDGTRLLINRSQQFANSLVQAGRRIILKFGNCVGHPSSCGTGTLACADLSLVP